MIDPRLQADLTNRLRDPLSMADQELLAAQIIKLSVPQSARGLVHQADPRDKVSAPHMVTDQKLLPVLSSRQSAQPMVTDQELPPGLISRQLVQHMETDQVLLPGLISALHAHPMVTDQVLLPLLSSRLHAHPMVIDQVLLLAQNSIVTAHLAQLQEPRKTVLLNAQTLLLAHPVLILPLAQA